MHVGSLFVDGENTKKSNLFYGVMYRLFRHTDILKFMHIQWCNKSFVSCEKNIEYSHYEIQSSNAQATSVHRACVESKEVQKDGKESVHVGIPVKF
jgi:hypothetical protein